MDIWFLTKDWRWQLVTLSVQKEKNRYLTSHHRYRHKPRTHTLGQGAELQTWITSLSFGHQKEKLILLLSSDFK